MSTLIIGYGNIDRGDDGVAWHIMSDILQYMSVDLQPGDFTEDIIPVHDSLDMLFALQLTPETALDLTNYRRVCFIDCHTGNQEEDLHHAAIEPVFETSPFTHHLTPPACLSLAAELTGKQPQAIHVSVRGHDFNFSDRLSHQTQILAGEAKSYILDWLDKE